jgi:hypothetical protein
VNIDTAPILALTSANVLKVYSGRPKANGNHCRCGCCGTYRYNPAHVVVGSSADRGYPLDAEDISAAQVKKVLRAIQAQVIAGNDSVTMSDTPMTMNDGWVDVTLPSGRCYTAYLVKEIK